MNTFSFSSTSLISSSDYTSYHLDISIDTYICVEHIMFLEALAKKNLKGRYPKIYDILNSNQSKFNEKSNEILEKILKKGSPSDNNLKELNAIFEKIKNAMLHKGAFTTLSDRLRYIYYKNAIGLLILDSKSIEEDLNQTIRKRKARKFLWNLFQNEIRMMIVADNIKLLTKILKDIIKLENEHTIHNQLSFKDWAKKYKEALDKFIVNLKKHLIDENCDSLWTDAIESEIDEKIKAETTINEDDVDYTPPPSNRSTDINSNKAIRSTTLKINDNISKLHDSLSLKIREHNTLAEVFVQKHFKLQQKKENEVKEHENNHKFETKINEYIKAKKSGKRAIGHFINENTAEFQTLLGNQLGFSIATGNFSETFKDSNTYLQLASELFGPAIATIPFVGVLLKSFISGFVEGMIHKKEADYTSKEVVEKLSVRINKLEKHIDDKLSLLKDDIIINNLYSNIKAKISSQTNNFNTKYKTIIEKKLDYESAKSKEDGLREITHFLTYFKSTIYDLLKLVYGCKIDKFLLLTPKPKGTIANNNLYFLDEKETKKITPEECYLSALKQKTIDHPKDYGPQKLKSDINSISDSLKTFFTSLFKTRNSLLEVYSNLHLIENDFKENQDNADLYYSLIKQTFEFEFNSFTDTNNLQTQLETQLGKAASFYLGVEGVAIFNAIDNGNYFYLSPKHILDNEEMVLGLCGNTDEKGNQSLVLQKLNPSKDGEIENQKLFKFINKENSFAIGNKTSFGKKQISSSKNTSDEKIFVSSNSKDEVYHLGLTDSDGYFSINLTDKEGKENLSLCVNSNKKEEGSKVTSKQKTNNPNQQFKLTPIFDTYVGINDFDTLYNKNSALYASFIPGSNIQIQVKYSSSIGSKDKDFFYLLLNSKTNNLEIYNRKIIDSKTNKSIDSLVWKAMDNPPDQSYTVSCKFNFNGNLQIKKHDNNGQEDEIIWETATEGFYFSSLSLDVVNGYPILRIKDNNSWTIWQSKVNRTIYSSECYLSDLNDSSEEILLNIRTEFSFKVSKYSSSGRRDYYENRELELIANSSKKVNWIRGKKSNSKNRQFRLKLVNPNRYLFQLICVDHDSSLALACVKDKNDYILELQDSNSEDETQHFYVNNTLDKSPKFRPKILLNTNYLLEYHDDLDGHASVQKTSVRYKPCEYFNNQRIYHLKNDKIKSLDEFMSNQMTAACFNNDDSKYIFFSNPYCWVRKVGTHSKSYGVNYIHEVFPNLTINSNITSVIYVSEEIGYYFFHGNQYTQYKKGKVIKTDLVKNKWGVDGNTISSVCLESHRGLLFFLLKKEDGSKGCKFTECLIDEKSNNTAYDISEYWYGLPSIEYNGVLFKHSNSTFYFYVGNIQYKLKLDGDKTKLEGPININDDNW